MNARGQPFHAEGQRPKPRRDTVFVSPLSGFGQFLRSASTFPNQPPIDVPTTEEVIRALFEGLRQANILRECRPIR